jgi:hypothetical protein
VKVEDGKLKFIAQIESYNGFNYTSGKVAARKKWRYGCTFIQFILNSIMAKPYSIPLSNQKK